MSKLLIKVSGHAHDLFAINSSKMITLNYVCIYMYIYMCVYTLLFMYSSALRH